MLVRVISAIVVIAIVLFCMVCNPVTRLFFIVAVSFMACYEMLNAIKKGGYKPLHWPAYVYTAGSAATIICHVDTQWILLLLVLIVMAAFTQRCLRPTMTDRDLFASLAPIFYPLLLITIITQIIWENSEYWPMIFLLGVIAVVFCDSFALFTGRAFGKHKMCPTISPKKTVEGLIGGMIFGTLSGLLVYFALPLFGLKVLEIPFCMIAAFFASGIGVFGDLAASTVKREAGIKDYSKLIPGHGGILDRIDSSIFAIPMVYVIFMIAQAVM